MNNSIHLVHYSVFEPKLNSEQIIGITSLMHDYNFPNNPNQSINIPIIARESDFENLETPCKKVIKMSKTNYIDNFFKDGSIQLGSFKYYQKFDNPEIGDKTEGWFVLVGENENQTIISVVSGGFNNYMLCCFDGDPDQNIINRFEYDDYFEINYLDGFTKAISNTLNATNYKRSKCFYALSKIMVGKVNPNFNPNIISADMIHLINNSKYFLKTSNFNHQVEYRFLWTIPSDIDDKKIIKCPEAIKFCKRK